MTVTFATFCHKGDAHRLHRPGQLRKQVESNGYDFDKVIVVHQLCNPMAYENSLFQDCPFKVQVYTIINLDYELKAFGIDIDKPQYVSSVDKAHTWKNHVANHLAALKLTTTEYIVFADADCWIIRQPDSWVSRGIEILSSSLDAFIVSPNDGEPARKTQVISQQMFMARTDNFRNADLNQPEWDGDVKNHPEMPEYHAMLEGRIHHYCKATGKYRYVLPPEYRYFHHNRLNEDDSYKMNYADYGIVGI